MRCWASPERPAVEALVVYNGNPVAVAPESGEVGARLCPRRPVHRGAGALPDRHRRLRGLRPARHHTAGALGHPPQLRPHRCAAQPPGHCPGGARRTATPRSFATWPPTWRATTQPLPPLTFTTVTKSLCRQALEGSSIDFAQLLQQGFAQQSLPDAPFARGGFATPSGQCEFLQPSAGENGHQPAARLPDQLLKCSSERYPLAMISPPARNFLNSTFVNVKTLRHIEGRPELEIHPADAAARGIADGDLVRVFNARGAHVCHAAVERARPPGRGGGLGHLVAQGWCQRHECERTHPPAAHRHWPRTRRFTTVRCR